MRWEELTGEDFPRAVLESKGVCVLVMGVIERHGPHLPLGTDMLNGLHVAELAAKREPAVVFPPWFLGQIYEARCFPGTIAIPPVLLVDLTLAVLDEIGRNGFTKIVLYVAHGGNNQLAPFLSQCQLHAKKPYQVYVIYADAGLSEDDLKRFNALMDVPVGGHADEYETSIMLAHRPELVKMQNLGDRIAKPLGRLNELAGQVKHFYSPLRWYADYPEHYAGDARKATADKGRRMLEIKTAAFADFLRRVKADQIQPALADEFFRREGQVGKP